MSKLDDTMLAEGWYTLARAAEITGVHFATIYRQANEGKLGEVMKAGDKKYVHRAALAVYVGPVAAKALGLA